jgi:chemotaxis protein histidine kinase CheA
MGMVVGLSVCHGIIKDHEGTIVVKNSSEGGAAFIIKLPVGLALGKVILTIFLWMVRIISIENGWERV